MTPGPLQILLIILVILILFGRNKIPQIMGDLAKGITSFKKGLKEEDQTEQPKVTDETKEK